ncbi:ergothioneine biosynthesis protein EgtB [Anaeromyxobacter terrae]|uniref:ergothioneine biosynthesis protein EgtB n=1 Tax=Anaeromyxobacter terrae TaxID=2925406 RepID=UPI001F56252A|nr:ergothioneine biosynthesis protein EgtB [Anaeromyxobacter sp. SG22]
MRASEGDAREAVRAETIAARLAAVRRRTVALASPLSPEDATVQSMPDASPAKWHLAHTSWFFEAFVLPRVERSFRPFHDAYAYLFNSYYEAVGPRQPRPQRGLLSRPALEEVLRYRANVDERMAAALAARLDDALLAVVEVGIAHEEQHQELLLTDVKHAFSSNPLRPAYAPGALPGRPRPATATPLGFVPREGGVVEIGAAAGGFAFDNERPRHRALVEPHALASRPTTNGEWLAFMDEGGYRRPELWLSDGFAAVQAGGWQAPLYWERGESGWSVFTLAGPRPLDPAEPVAHVSYYEADAFARWAGARLPTEVEWEAAAAGAEEDGTFADDGRFHPAAAAPGPGLRQLLGDVWEWTSSAYAPYPGFRPLAGALGEYNGKFMVNQLTLRGGSCATPRGHVRPTYRNFFPPGARWQFTGVRLARDRA